MNHIDKLSIILGVAAVASIGLVGAALIFHRHAMRTREAPPGLPDDENFECSVSLRGDKKRERAILLTDKAAYWVVTTLFAVHNDMHLGRVPIGSILRIRIGRTSPFLSVPTGLLLLVAGAAFLAAKELEHGLAWLVGGFLLTAFGQRRLTVVIEASEHALRWRSPLGFGSQWHADQQREMETLADWAGRHGIPCDFEV